MTRNSRGEFTDYFFHPIQLRLWSIRHSSGTLIILIIKDMKQITNYQKMQEFWSQGSCVSGTFKEAR